MSGQRRPYGLSQSDAYAVVQVNDAVSEPALIEKFELRADVVWQGALAASHHDRAHMLRPRSAAKISSITASQDHEYRPTRSSRAPHAALSGSPAGGDEMLVA
jgi:hypothetical protein